MRNSRHLTPAFRLHIPIRISQGIREGPDFGQRTRAALKRLRCKDANRSERGCELSATSKRSALRAGTWHPQSYLKSGFWPARRFAAGNWCTLSAPLDSTPPTARWGAGQWARVRLACLSRAGSAARPGHVAFSLRLALRRSRYTGHVKKTAMTTAQMPPT